jgi:hypothetical protein
MVLDRSATAPGTYLYSGTAPGDRPAGDYTVRALPYRDGVSIPLEVGCITWQK